MSNIFDKMDSIKESLDICKFLESKGIGYRCDFFASIRTHLIIFFRTKKINVDIPVNIYPEMTLQEFRSIVTGIYKAHVQTNDADFINVFDHIEKDIIPSCFKPVHPAPSINIGFPTQSIDVYGNTIRLGDEIAFGDDYSSNRFIVIFEDNAFRKQYKRWRKGDPKPILECGDAGVRMRFRIINK